MSTTLITRTCRVGSSRRKMSAAASVSSVGTSPAQANTTSRDTDQNSGLESTQCIVFAVALSELVRHGFQIGRMHHEKPQVAFPIAERFVQRNHRVDIRGFEPAQQHRDAIPKRRGEYIVHKFAFHHRHPTKLLRLSR